MEPSVAADSSCYSQHSFSDFYSDCRMANDASSVKDTVVSASSVKDTAVSASSFKDIVMSAPFKENVISESLQDDAASSPFKHTAESADTAVTCSSAPVPPPLSLSITVDVLSDAPDNHQIWSPTPPPSPGNRWLLATTSDNTRYGLHFITVMTCVDLSRLAKWPCG